MRSPHARSGSVPRQKELASFYVGTRVAKQFASGWFRGAVVSTRHAKFVDRTAPRTAMQSWPVPPGAAAPADPGYLGVCWVPSIGRWNARIKVDGNRVSLGVWALHEAEKAARAYDEAARLQGKLKLNFPIPGTGEFQAVSRGARGRKAKTAQPSAERNSPKEGEQLRACKPSDAPAPITALPAATPLPLAAEPGAAPAAKAGLPDTAPRKAKAAADTHAHLMPEGPRYVGVSWDGKLGNWKASIYDRQKGKSKYLGSFAGNQQGAEAAARAYDAAARAHGRRHFNFPTPGTNELQAEFNLSRRAGKRKALAATSEPALESEEQPGASKRMRPAAPPAKPPAATPLTLTAAAHGDGAPGFPDDDDGAAFDTPPEPTEQRTRIVAAPATASPPGSPEPEAFIRSIAPPLTQPAAVLRAMRSGHVQLAHIKRLARMLGDAAVSDLAVERTLQAAFSQWGVLVPGDQMALRCALASLTAEQLQ